MVGNLTFAQDVVLVKVESQSLIKSLDDVRGKARGECRDLFGSPRQVMKSEVLR